MFFFICAAGCLLSQMKLPRAHTKSLFKKANHSYRQLPAGMLGKKTSPDKEFFSIMQFLGDLYSPELQNGTGLYLKREIIVTLNLHTVVLISTSEASVCSKPASTALVVSQFH